MSADRQSLRRSERLLSSDKRGDEGPHGLGPATTSGSGSSRSPSEASKSASNHSANSRPASSSSHASKGKSKRKKATSTKSSSSSEASGTAAHLSAHSKSASTSSRSSKGESRKRTASSSHVSTRKSSHKRSGHSKKSKHREVYTGSVPLINAALSNVRPFDPKDNPDPRGWIRSLGTAHLIAFQGGTPHPSLAQIFASGVRNLLSGKAGDWHDIKWHSPDTDDEVFPTFDEFAEAFKIEFLNRAYVGALRTEYKNLAPRIGANLEAYLLERLALHRRCGYGPPGPQFRADFLASIPERVRAYCVLHRYYDDSTGVHELAAAISQVWEDHCNQKQGKPSLCFLMTPAAPVLVATPSLFTSDSDAATGRPRGIGPYRIPDGVCNYCGKHKATEHCRARETDSKWRGQPRCLICTNSSRTTPMRDVGGGPAQHSTFICPDNTLDDFNTNFNRILYGRDASPTPKEKTSLKPKEKQKVMVMVDDGPNASAPILMQEGFINGTPTTLAIDSCSGINTITPDFVKKLGIRPDPAPTMQLSGTGSSSSSSTARATVRIGGIEEDVTFRVVELPIPVLLGKLAIDQFGIATDHRRVTSVRRVHLQTSEEGLSVQSMDSVDLPGGNRAVPIRVTTEGRLAPGSRVRVDALDSAADEGVWACPGSYRVNGDSTIDILVQRCDPETPASIEAGDTFATATAISAAPDTAMVNVTTTTSTLPTSGQQPPLPEGMTPEEDAHYRKRLQANAVTDSMVNDWAVSNLQHCQTHERERWIALIKRHRLAFVKEGEHPVPALIPAYRVDTVGVGRAEKARPWSHTVEKALSKDLLECIDAGILEVGTRTPFRHEWVIVKKKDGTLRFTVDYSSTNIRNVVADSFPINNMKKVVESLAGHAIYCEFDMRKAYYCLWLHPASRPVTAVRIPISLGGVAVYKTAPMGLKTSAAALARGVEGTIFSELPDDVREFFHRYADNIALRGDSFEQVWNHTSQFLAACIKWRVQLSLSSLTLGTDHLDSFGYHIDKKGHSPSRPVVDVMMEVSPPINATEIRSFLGFTVQYRKFIPNFSTIAKPLTRLTEKHRRFLWDDACQRSFDAIKSLISNAQTLAPVDYSKPFVLATDASDVGIGAVLYQENRPISCFSKALTATEQRAWKALDKEWYAGVAAIKHFAPYLDGNEFVWQTDHEPLTQNTAPAVAADRRGRRKRWSDFISSHNIKPVYIPGREMDAKADALSRPPFVTAATALVISPLPQRTDWAVEQRKDPQLSAWMDAALSDKPPADFQVGKDGVLLHIAPRRASEPREDTIAQVVIPHHRRHQVMDEQHSRIHCGALRMELTLRETVWWPNMLRDLSDYKRGCVTCQRWTPVPDNHGPLESVTAEHPMDIVAFDLIGPLPVNTEGCDYVVVGVDYHTSFPFANMVKGKSTATVIKAITSVFDVFGVPRSVTTDGDQALNSAEMKAYLEEELGVSHYTTRAYNARGNGMAENMVKLIKHPLLKLGGRGLHNWGAYLSHILLTLRTTVSTVKKLTPHFLMFGWNPRVPRLPDVLQQPNSLTRGTSLASVRKEVSKLMEAEKERQRKYHDRDHGEAITYEEGDLVWIGVPKKKKTNPPRRGPYKITQVGPRPQHYTIADSTLSADEDPLGRQDPVIHRRRLAPFHPAPEEDPTEGSSNRARSEGDEDVGSPQDNPSHIDEGPEEDIDSDNDATRSNTPDGSQPRRSRRPHRRPTPYWNAANQLERAAKRRDDLGD